MLLDVGLADIVSCWLAKQVCLFGVAVKTNKHSHPGLLAQIVLTAEELRHLVRALFSNSELRATSLAQIVLAA
jgi:hypothetical protein